MEIGLEDYEESKYPNDGYGNCDGIDCQLCSHGLEWLTFLRSQTIYPPPVLTRPLLKAA